ncbi:unnamed protein product [Sphenostylis stenocarpa]|uniref:Uncharacterized protein n=1 Tax=Sphenostylis stenocarpa TaxID=92480 RepID=A0AA86SSN6_9FABA|nr:unnamed protein product [Sphenostylis stenocarpa]
MDGQDSQDPKQSPADMTAFVQNLLQQMTCYIHELWKKDVFLDVSALDDMGNRINELEQSINDLRAEMGVESSPSPVPTAKPTEEETKEEVYALWVTYKTRAIQVPFIKNESWSAKNILEDNSTVYKMFSHTQLMERVMRGAS